MVQQTEGLTLMPEMFTTQGFGWFLLALTRAADQKVLFFPTATQVIFKGTDIKIDFVTLVCELKTGDMWTARLQVRPPNQTGY